MAEMPPENPNRPREYHGGRTLVAGVGVVVVIALVLWLALLRGGDEATMEGIVELPAALNPDGRDVGPRILAMAPDFELETLDGERLRLSDLRGRPVVINFWASWCSPCRREVPALIRAQRENADSGLVVIGVNIEEPRSAAQVVRRRLRRRLRDPDGLRRQRLPGLRRGRVGRPAADVFRRL